MGISPDLVTKNSEKNMPEVTARQNRPLLCCRGKLHVIQFNCNALFLPVVFILYWAMPHKFQWIILLISSYYFYMSWNPKYVVLILGTTVISYVAGILIDYSHSKAQKKIVMGISAVVCLGVLFVFKYFNFAANSFCEFLRLFSLKLNPITLKLILPVGISFYTFQTFSYVIDVYRGDISAERHFGCYAAFISFFPQLVAGPRLQDMPSILRAYPNYVVSAAFFWATGSGNKVDRSSYYTSGLFNEYGDYIYDRPFNTDYSFLDADISVPEIEDACVNRLNALNDYAEERGATLLIAAYPICDVESTPDETEFQVFQDRLDAELDAEIISDYTEYFFPKEYFYESTLHLTNEGADLRTTQLIKDLKIWLSL